METRFCLIPTFLLMCVLNDALTESPAVTTKLGVINGKSVTHSFRGKEYVTHQFLGIPYAKPPTGPLRFKRPQPNGQFSKPYDAITIGSPCPQSDLMKIGLVSNNEDCLFLNVFVPTDGTDSTNGFAVMIFIHGGGFNMGSGDMFPAEYLSSYGKVILVTINYRLGVFGFANTGDDKARGNMGLWDQRLAIQWVNENIEAFGGDPSRITIFGESAGSVSVLMQGMYQDNKGLFQNIIAESGTPTMPIVGGAKDNLGQLSRLVSSLECSSESTESVFSCLRDVDVETLMAKLAPNEHNADEISYFPTIDGDFFKRLPLETIKMADTNPPEIEFLRSLRVINGINSAEGAMWLLFTFGTSQDFENFVLSQEDLKNIYIQNTLKMFGPVSELLLSLVASEYTDWSNPSDGKHMYVKFMGDLFFNVPGVEFSLLHANATGSKHWLYSFDARLGKHLVPCPSWVDGANHGDELMPVFGYGENEFTKMTNISDYSPPEWELDLSERMMTQWSNFAKYGDPNGLGAVEWPEFDVEFQKHLKIARENSVEQRIYAREVKFWRELVPLVISTLKSIHASESPFAKTPSDTCDADGTCG